MSSARRLAGALRRGPSIDTLVRLTVAVVVVLVGLATWTLWLTSQGRTAAAASRRAIAAQVRSDEITACRSEWRTPIDRADAQLEEATARLEAARTTRDDAFLVGLVATVTNDDATLAGLLDQVPAARAEVAAAQADVDTAARAKAEAAGRYDRAVRLSRTDPDRLLAECRRLPP